MGKQHCTLVPYPVRIPATDLGSYMADNYGWPQDTYAGGWAGHVWHAHNSFYSVWMNDRTYSQLQESTVQWHSVAKHLDYVHTIAFAVFR